MANDDKKADTEKKEPKKGKEPWRHKYVGGGDHPDDNPPVTKVAKASKENAEKYEDSVNAEREKLFAVAEPEEDEGNGKDDKKK